MARIEQRALAEDVKAVHRKLREQLLEGGKEEEVWRNHIQDQETLDKYSESMKLLATSYWESSGEESRVQWVKKEVESYFWGGGEAREERKDQKRLWRSEGNAREEWAVEKAPSNGDCNLDYETLDQENRKDVEKAPLRVLDVGSCYNPFGEFEDWQVLPVDIAPATPCVRFCDFLSVELAAETLIQERNHKTEVKSLEAGGYHVVIFCLLLEYLPSAALRLQAVEKAVGSLKEGGLLCIVTPDSCHQARNSEQLSSWKLGLGLLGLSKVTYTKAKHFHGLVYRKPSCFQMELVKSECREAIGRKRKVSSKENNVDNMLEENNTAKDQSTKMTSKDAQLKSLFYIPQDFSTQVNPKGREKVEMSSEERFQMVESFSDLPMDI